MEATILFVAVTALILLAVMSMRYGVDSRDAFASKDRELAARGIIWGEPTAAWDRPQISPTRLNRNVPAQKRVRSEDCVPAPCRA